MKRVFVNILLISCFFIASSKAYAICSNEEIVKYNKEASQIKLVNEIIKEDYPSDEQDPENELGIEYTPTRDVFKVSATNLTDNVYVLVKNSLDDKVENLSNQTGKTFINFYNHMNLVTLTYEIYTANSTACPGEKLMTGYLTLPKANPYANITMCENSDSEYCKQYVDHEITQEEFDKYTKSLVTEHDKEMKQKEDEEKAAAKKNKKIKKILIISGCVLGAGLIATTVVVVVKRRGRVL